MKGIQKFDKDISEWRLISAAYSGLSAADAKTAISQLRKWAKEDGSGAKYRIVETVLVPR